MLASSYYPIQTHNYITQNFTANSSFQNNVSLHSCFVVSVKQSQLLKRIKKYLFAYLL